MSKKLKLFLITLASFLFSITMMSIFYVLSYLNFQKYPTDLFHSITMDSESKLILLISLNILYTLILFLNTFINLYIIFIDNKNSTPNKGN